MTENIRNENVAIRLCNSTTNISELVSCFDCNLLFFQCISKNCEIGDTTNEASLWLFTAYTFQVTETVARFQGRPLLSPPSVRIKQALSSAVRSSFLSSKYYQVLMKIIE